MQTLTSLRKEDESRQSPSSDLAESRPAGSEILHDPHALFRLQRTIGNRAVQRLLRARADAPAQVPTGPTASSLVAPATLQRTCAACATESPACDRCSEEEEKGKPLQRQTAPATAQPDSATARAEDPNFLLCLALCELGVPPSLWRTVVNQVLSAVSQEYRHRYGDMRGSRDFESWRAEFTLWSDFNKLKFLVGFLGESRVGIITLEHAGALAIRQAILDQLLRAGLREGALVAASQILRKAALFIEAAWAAGCASYCGATAFANAILAFTTGAIEAIASFATTLGQIGDGLAQLITRPILLARITMDPVNWDLSALPLRSRAHMGAIGLAFRLAFTPDTFLASVGRPLSSYNVPNLLDELSQDINATLQSRGGFGQLITFTPQFIGGLTPLQLVNILKDYRLLSFLQDPERLADQQQSAASSVDTTP